MRIFSVLVLASALLSAQTRPDKSSRVALGTIDFSGAAMTKPFRAASAPSGSCSNAAEVLLAVADIWGCVSGTWTKIGGGGGGTPGGSSGQIQFNNGGAFGGIDSTGSGNVLRASDMLAIGSGNNYRFGSVSADGTDTEWRSLNQMTPLVVSNNGSDIATGACGFRDTVDGGYFESIALESTDGGTTPVTGSITLQFSVTTNGTLYTNIGTVSLTSQNRVVDQTLTAWNRTIEPGLNSRVRVCVISVGSGMKYVFISPRFR